MRNRRCLGLRLRLRLRGKRMRRRRPFGKSNPRSPRYGRRGQ